MLLALTHRPVLPLGSSPVFAGVSGRGADANANALLPDIDDASLEEPSARLG
jgi:hypothetical protein